MYEHILEAVLKMGVSLNNKILFCAYPDADSFIRKEYEDCPKPIKKSEYLL